MCFLKVTHCLEFLGKGNNLHIASASLFICICQCGKVNKLHWEGRHLCNEMVSFKSLSAGTQAPRAANCLPFLFLSQVSPGRTLIYWLVTIPGSWAQHVPTAENTLLTLMNDYRVALI